MRLSTMALIALASTASGALAQTRDPKLLDDVPRAPATKQQSDLDPLTLASAQRERARSVEERTSGLWQSWLVSICQGCGEAPRRTFVPPSLLQAERAAQNRQVAEAQARLRAGGSRRHFDLYSSLSPDAVGQIRVMPGH
ncbi:hypothetical protein [Methylobacterium nigriterrae]|uniref:hypothetical protein n=1 Tax=Methylobacterium nigriterrae TaxID=3127512 RepID=UPI0030133618